MLRQMDAIERLRRGRRWLPVDDRFRRLLMGLALEQWFEQFIGDDDGEQLGEYELNWIE